MFSYQPPLKHMRYVLSSVLDSAEVLRTEAGYGDLDDALFGQILDQAGRFAAEVLFPLNARGDRQGCRFDGGAVATPDGFAEAYRQFVADGWPALGCDAEDGGQGLPHLLACVIQEMLVGANHAWSMYGGLLHGAYSCLKTHGSEELKRRYLHRIVSGEWLATMCLTEPQAGSDLGLLRTRAVMGGQGAYRLSGSKVFISGGEHDFTDNILHFVLARIEGAPPGSKGLSLFLVPKLLPDGGANAVRCTGIEHKMGIRGSATCSMEFCDAQSWLIGEPNRGLAAMFAMMNAARLLAGAQGLGIAEATHQNAARYAAQRSQGRAVGRPAGQGGLGADPIALHPPVRRLLGAQRAYVEGGRMMLYWSAMMLDLARRHPDGAQRAELEQTLALVTPVVKAFLTQQGFMQASSALQVYGGYGVITESGIEQYLRDSRVTMIYEGSNEIQAIDLVVRKIVGDGGDCLGRLLREVKQTADDEREGPFARHAERLADLAGEIAAIGDTLSTDSTLPPELSHWLAPDILRLVGHCLLGWFWLRSARVSRALREDDPAFHDARLETASHYFTFEFGETQAALASVRACFAERQWALAVDACADGHQQ